MNLSRRVSNILHLQGVEFVEEVLTSEVHQGLLFTLVEVVEVVELLTNTVVRGGVGIIVKEIHD